MDSNRIRLCGNVGFGLVGRGKATFRKVVFSSRKVELVVKKKRPIATGVTLAGLSAFVRTIIVVVQV